MQRDEQQQQQPCSGTSSSSAGGSASSASSGASGNAAWTKDLVVTRLSNAALCCAWAPGHATFAIGSASRGIAVCASARGAGPGWWTSKLIKRAHDSSVVDVAWHPRGGLLASASTDGTVRVFNASVEGARPPATKFGQLLLTVTASYDWVHSVCWTPGSGEHLLFATHACRVHVVNASRALAGGEGVGDGSGGTASAANIQAPDASLETDGLPLKVLRPLSDTLVVGAGWDGLLYVLRRPHAGGGGSSGVVDADSTADGSATEGGCCDAWKVECVLGSSSVDKIMRQNPVQEEKQEQGQMESGGRTLDPRQLTCLIKGCETADGLFSLAQQHHAWNYIHASAAMARAGNLLRGAHMSPAATSGVALLLRVAREQLPEMDAQGLANTLWAVSKLDVRDRAFVGAFKSEAQPKLAGFKAQELANTAYALAKLGHKDTGFMTMLLAEASTKLHSFDAQQLSNILWAMAKMGHRDENFVRLLLVAAAPKLASFTEQALSNTAWTLATRGHKDEVFMDALLIEAKLKLHSFTSQALANTLWALATLDHKDAACMGALLVAAKLKLSSFKPQELANTAMALAALDYHDAAFMGALLVAATPKLPRFNMKDVKEISIALKKLNITDPEFESALEARRAQLGRGPPAPATPPSASSAPPQPAPRPACRTEPAVAVVLAALPTAWVEAAAGGAALSVLRPLRQFTSLPQEGERAAVVERSSAWSAGSCRISSRRLAGGVGGLACAPQLPDLLPSLQLRGAAPRVCAGLRGLEAAVPALWRVPLLNARKEPIWRLWVGSGGHNIDPDQILHLIRDCTTADSLFSLAQQQRHAWNHIHARVALVKVVTLLEVAPISANAIMRCKPGVALLLKLADGWLPYMDTQDQAHTWAVAQLVGGGPAGVADPFDATSTKLSSYTPQQLAKRLWALATLGLDSKDAAVVGALLVAAKSKLPSFTAQQLSTILLAIATMGHRDESFVGLLLLEAKLKLPSFTAQQQASTVWALATLESKDEAFMGALLTAAKSQLSGLAAQELATLGPEDVAFMGDLPSDA
ncbi:hypothetical protein FOA52_010062 [Chlamydomonas sp. UWO 241]|nr:hypothetical protein FOA52_010062 [Chlamydomonas sp. UWO 241]